MEGAVYHNKTNVKACKAKAVDPVSILLIRGSWVVGQYRNDSLALFYGELIQQLGREVHFKQKIVCCCCKATIKSAPAT